MHTKRSALLFTRALTGGLVNMGSNNMSSNSVQLFQPNLERDRKDLARQ